MNLKMTRTPARTTLMAFVAVIFIGGTNFVAVKFSNAELPPLFGAGIRFAAATLIFLGIMKARRMKLPRGRELAGAAVYGLLSVGMFYALLYFALIGLSAGTTSVILASVPLVTLVMAVLQGQEKFTSRGLVGGLLALGGIAVLSYRTLEGEMPVLSLLAALGGAFAASEAAVLVKGFPKSDPITTNAVGMGVGATGLLLASAITREPWFFPGQMPTWLALVWLVAVGSVGLFGLFVFVIKRWKASASVYAVTLMPVVAVSLGALLANESISLESIAGGLLVVLGVYVGALSAGRRARSPLKAASPSIEEKALA